MCVLKKKKTVDSVTAEFMQLQSADNLLSNYSVL